MQNAVGSTVVVTAGIGGVDVSNLLDTDSNVSTISEALFNEHFRPMGARLRDVNNWLTPKAANDLEVLNLWYLGVGCSVE